MKRVPLFSPEETKVLPYKQQVSRLSGYKGFEDYREELLRIGQRDATSIEHLKDTVTEIVDTLRPNQLGWTPCPTPAELREALKATRAASVFSKPDSACPRCDGTGWRLAKDRAGNDAVMRCRCTRADGSTGKDAAAGRDE